MDLQIKKVLVANRGEIAVRIIRAAHELGMATVAVYSEADRDSLAVRMADEAVAIGPSHAAKSYLNIDAVISAAVLSGADAIHPGYGFLSENAAFARAVEAAGLIFVGPAPETIEMMGDKALARDTARRAGVPTVPGSAGVIATPEEAVRIAREIGYPIMIKATAGGGGRGIRVAYEAEELVTQLGMAQSEALAAFGDKGVYLERFIGQARHIEVQILGDGERAVHCWERECSLQRRRQKIWEEAPSPVLDTETRTRLCGSAVKLAQAVNYRGAGTLEYLYDSQTGEFFFIEMNTRIQVEHPITEMVTGIDLVKEMLCIASGHALSLWQQDVVLRGAAIECRINAEDPLRNFMPCPGLVTELQWPTGPGVRIDSMLYPGFKVPAYYDSMLAKLIVWGEDRPAALARLQRALSELRVGGIKTTVDLHQALAADPLVRAADYHTNLLETWMPAYVASLLESPPNPADASKGLVREESV